MRVFENLSVFRHVGSTGHWFDFTTQVGLTAENSFILNTEHKVNIQPCCLNVLSGHTAHILCLTVLLWTNSATTTNKPLRFEFLSHFSLYIFPCHPWYGYGGVCSPLNWGEWVWEQDQLLSQSQSCVTAVLQSSAFTLSWGHTTMPPWAGLVCWRFNKFCGRVWMPWPALKARDPLKPSGNLWHFHVGTTLGGTPCSNPSWAWDLLLQQDCKLPPPSVPASSHRLVISASVGLY